MPGEVRNYLQSRGFQLSLLEPPYSSVNSVAKFRNSLTSHSDTRGGGVAARLGGEFLELQDNKEDSNLSIKEKQSDGVNLEGEKTSDVEMPEDGLRDPENKAFYPPVSTDDQPVSTDDQPVSTDDQPVSTDDQSVSTSTKLPDTDIPSRKQSGNKKFMGDAEIFTTVESSGPEGTGKVVKGDKRGGGFHPLPPTTFVNSDHGPDPNSGHGLDPNPASVIVPFNGHSNPGAVPPFFQQVRHPSQVKVDPFNEGQAGDAPFVEVPLNIWNQPHQVIRSRLPYGHQGPFQPPPGPIATPQHVFIPGLGPVPIDAVRFEEGNPVLSESIRDSYSNNRK